MAQLQSLQTSEFSTAGSIKNHSIDMVTRKQWPFKAWLLIISRKKQKKHLVELFGELGVWTKKHVANMPLRFFFFGVGTHSQ